MIFYASWRQERETAIADLLAATKDAKYCTVEYRRQRRRTAAIDLWDATKVISSSSSVCGAGPCRGVHLSSSSRESYRVSSCEKIHLLCSSGEIRLSSFCGVCRASTSLRHQPEVMPSQLPLGSTCLQFLQFMPHQLQG